MSATLMRNQNLTPICKLFANKVVIKNGNSLCYEKKNYARTKPIVYVVFMYNSFSV